MTATVLLIEDDEGMAQSISLALKHQHYKVVALRDTAMARSWLESSQSSVDVVLLDWMLPGESGLSMVKFLRQSKRWAHLPLIMLTAKSDESDRVLGLEAGADDYVCKPFSMKELNARIQALIRRFQRHGEDHDDGRDGGRAGVINLTREKDSAGERDLPTRVEVGAITLMPELLLAQHGNGQGAKVLRVTVLEMRLLVYLARHQRTIGRPELIDKVWGNARDIEERSVDVTINRLRKRWESAFVDMAATNIPTIDTLRGLGYRLTVPKKD